MICLLLSMKMWKKIMPPLFIYLEAIGIFSFLIVTEIIKSVKTSRYGNDVSTIYIQYLYTYILTFYCDFLNSTEMKQLLSEIELAKFQIEEFLTEHSEIYIPKWIWWITVW